MDARNTPKSETRLYGLVRDKHGRPKIDGDPTQLPQELIALLTPAERAELGV